MIRLQRTIFSPAVYVYTIHHLIAACKSSHFLPKCLVNAPLTCTSRNTIHYSGITCTQEVKPVIPLNELTCRLWKVCWGPGALCLWTPSHPGHPRFPWWHWSSSGSQTANIQSVNIWRRKICNFLLIRTMTKKYQSDKDATSTPVGELLGLLFAFFTLGMLEMATFFFRKALRCFRKKKSSLNHNTIFN